MKIEATHIKGACSNKVLPGGRKDDRALPPWAPKPHLNMLFSGRTGSGKSNALVRLLQAYQKLGVFQKQILISPTAKTDHNYSVINLDEKHEVYSDNLIEDIIEEQKADMDEYEKDLEKIELYDRFMKANKKARKRFTQEELMKLMTFINMEGVFERPQAQFDKHPYLVIILDDLGGTPAFRNGNCTLNSLVCKSRHYQTNIVISTQHPYQCPRALRAQLSNLALFPCKDMTLIKEMAQQNASTITPEQFMALHEYSCKEQHNFLWCDFRTNEYRKNYDTALTISGDGAVDLPNKKSKDTPKNTEEAIEEKDKKP